MQEKCIQNWTLRFNDKSIESAFKSEILSMQSFSRLALVCISILVLSSYILQNSFSSIPWYTSTVILAPLSQEYKIRVLILESLSLAFLSLTANSNELLEVLGGLFPSFILELYIWDRLDAFIILSLCKFLYLQLHSWTNFFISLATYCVLAVLVHKEIRKLWAKIKKIQGKNKIFSELWMSIPYPVVLISQKSAIKLKNLRFDEKFGPAVRIEEVFHENNVKVVDQMIKKVFLGSPLERVMFKENGSIWMVFAICVEWKFERCAEISVVELANEKFNSVVLASVQEKHNELIGRLEELVVEGFMQSQQIDHSLLQQFNLLFTNIWTYNLFLEQQIDYNSKHEERELDLCIELINTIELLYNKEDPTCPSFQLNLLTQHLTTTIHEIKLKLFLFTLLSYLKLNSEKASQISITLQESDSNQNTSKQSLSITFSASTASASTASDLNQLVQPSSKKLLHQNLGQGDLPLLLFPFVLASLSIEPKPVVQSDSATTLAFILHFRHHGSKLGGSPQPRKIVWQNPESSQKAVRSRVAVCRQGCLAVVPRHKPLLSKIEIKSNSSRNSSAGHSPQSMPNFIHPRSLATIGGISGGFFKRSITMFKLKKSRNNRNKSPRYETTDKRPVKRFFYKESVKKLNYEIGVFKVLIVDDFEEGRRVVQGLIKEIMNASCEFAKDGLGALEMFDSYASQGFMYQIIFLDLVMPRMGGYDAALQIRMKERKNLFPKTFICAISGDRDCYGKVAKFEIDEVGKRYLALKPLDIAKVEAIIRHAKMAAEANN